jgi:S1-C subfamily serine protease
MAHAGSAHRRVALGLAIAALGLSAAAAIVVIGHGRAAPAQLVDRDVAEADLAQLGSFHQVEPAHPGVTLTDPKLAATLGLAAGDVITAIDGVPVARDFDVHEAIGRGASTVYVETARGVLVRWHVASSGQMAKVPGLARDLGAAGPAPAASDPLDVITRVDDTTVTAPRALRDAVIANPMKYLGGVRIVPNVIDGKPHGFKLYKVAAGSLAARIGLRAHDIVRTINGVDLMQPNLWSQSLLAGTDRVTFEVERDGKAVVLQIDVR